MIPCAVVLWMTEGPVLNVALSPHQSSILLTQCPVSLSHCDYRLFLKVIQAVLSKGTPERHCLSALSPRQHAGPRRGVCLLLLWGTAKQQSQSTGLTAI